MSKIDHISNTYQYGAVLITVISLFLTVTEKSFPFPKIGEYPKVCVNLQTDVR